MPVDMVINRFMEELRLAVPTPFRREGSIDPDMQKRRLPPYRHVFHALCLFEHSNGYRLPSYERFKRTYLLALKHHPSYRNEKDELFVGKDAVPGLLHRMGGWYLDGLAHTHLYCVLVQAYEEQRRIGAVMMDARVDAKLKTDIAIVTPGLSVRVDIRFSRGARQKDILSQRAEAEAVAKRRNSSSSHIGNPFYERGKTAVISHAHMQRDALTGVRLFTPFAIDRLLEEIDDHLGVPKDQAISYAAMKNRSMGNLQHHASR